jgi:hypothetical protein
MPSQVAEESTTGHSPCATVMGSSIVLRRTGMMHCSPYYALKTIIYWKRKQLEICFVIEAYCDRFNFTISFYKLRLPSKSVEN